MLKDFAKAIHETDAPLPSDTELLEMMRIEDDADNWEPDTPNEYDGDPDWEQ